MTHSISYEIYTRVAFSCALLWLYINFFFHITQAYVTYDCPSVIYRCIRFGFSMIFTVTLTVLSVSVWYVPSAGVALLALEQSYDCPRTTEVILKGVDKRTGITKHNTAKAMWIILYMSRKWTLSHYPKHWWYAFKIAINSNASLWATMERKW